MSNEAIGIVRTSELNIESRPDSTWATTNLAEAMPGVLTPLSWNIWGSALELGSRRFFAELGVLPAGESGIPDAPADRVIGAFYGRPAFRLEFWCSMGDRLPGSSGAAVSQQMASYTPPAPPDRPDRPDRRHYPRAVAKFVAAFVQGPRVVRRERREVARWYPTALGRLAQQPSEQAVRDLFDEAHALFRRSVYRQGKTFFCGSQLIYDLLCRLTASTSVSADSLMGGYGSHEEVGMVTDLWRCSRGQLDPDTFITYHGHHGPKEGELSSTVWRENPDLVSDLITRYRALDESQAPAAQHARLAIERAERERRFLAEVPRPRRPVAGLVLRLAAAYVPLRGVAKVTFLQCLDVLRASTRRLGEHRVAAGLLDAPDDVFFLTLDELNQPLLSNVRDLIATRRAERLVFESVELPTVFHGTPTPVTSTGPVSDAGDLTGTGVSPGVVEGIARVVLDTAHADIEEGDILVAHTTDPSWASLMFLAAGLVVDIGGPLSHAAVVARELGIPCVMNTQSGTKVLRSGDRCRIDGAAGTVTVLDHRPRS